MPLPLLYSFRRCPYAMRARLALRAASIECELREVVLRDKPSSLLQLSPKGTVPVLLLPDGRVIEESADIAHWALSLNDPLGWLSPCFGTSAEVVELVDRAEPDFKYHLDRYKYACRYDEAPANLHRELASRFLEELEERLQGAPWLYGARQSWADVGIVPFVRQFANTDRSWFDAQSWSSLRKWLVDFEESASFSAIMQKYPQWHEGDESTYLLGDTVGSS